MTRPTFFHQKVRKGCPIGYAKFAAIFGYLKKTLGGVDTTPLSGRGLARVGGPSCSLGREIVCNHPFDDWSAFSGRFAVPRPKTSNLTFEIKKSRD